MFKQIKLVIILIVLMPWFAIANNEVATKAMSAEELKTYLSELQQQEMLRAKFKETKILPSLSKALQSSGDFIYIKDLGVMWKREKPFVMQTVITKHGVAQWIEGEKQPQSQQAQKMMQPILQIVLAILSGEFVDLTEQFIITKLPAENNRWALMLKPKAAEIKPYLKEIQVSGGQHIELVHIINTKDKYTNVIYSSHQVGEGFIKNEEREKFNQ